jgi:hypothetical protein
VTTEGTLGACLVDTGPICYSTPEGLTWRPCRTWRHPDMTVSIVTEIGDGPSAAEYPDRIMLALAQVHGPSFRYVDHHMTGDNDLYVERYRLLDVVIRSAVIHSRTLWRLLGTELDTTRPTGPVVNGVWPSKRAGADL